MWQLQIKGHYVLYFVSDSMFFGCFGYTCMLWKNMFKMVQTRVNYHEMVPRRREVFSRRSDIAANG